MDKTELALNTIEQYPDLQKILGYERASYEMGLLLGEYVLRGELNQFEADLIGVIAILGNIATNVMNENERLRDGV